MENEVAEFLKDAGCCGTCCLRFLRLRDPKAYENSKKHLDQIISNGDTNLQESTNDGEPCVKKKKMPICICCIGLLQEENWDECVAQVQKVLNKKKYPCSTFACGLSAPIATFLREKSIVLLLEEKFPEYPSRSAVSLKEAWRWSFGVYLSERIDKTLDSGAISPLLITLNMEYPDELEELEYLKALSPKHFEERSKQRRRYNIDFTRRSVELALEGLSLEALREHWHSPPTEPNLRSKCISVVCNHAPLYLGGRYNKLSRKLPQTPWMVMGKRIVESSVQEIIFEPIAELFQIPQADIENRLKIISAGREDVDVRCLGNGRPFAIEVIDPIILPTEDQLTDVCLKIRISGDVAVNSLKVVDKDDLSLLKKGEESKSKVYEALCLKLSHSEGDKGTNINGEAAIVVTDLDIKNVNSYSNVEDNSCRVQLQQKTPIRVLHRRPLLTRQRKILDLEASLVPDHPQLLKVRIRTEAGTYVKEWVHGDLGRSKPSLRDALGAQVDILSLDVCAVELDWPI